MQTDPNFANYRLLADAGRLVLLDSSGLRAMSMPRLAQRAGSGAGYRQELSGDCDAVREAARAAGFLGEAAVVPSPPAGRPDDRDTLVTEMNRPGPFDFGDRGFVEVLREQGMEMAADRSTWHIPPVETLFRAWRKIAAPR